MILQVPIGTAQASPSTPGPLQPIQGHAPEQNWQGIAYAPRKHIAYSRRAGKLFASTAITNLPSHCRLPASKCQIRTDHPALRQVAKPGQSAAWRSCGCGLDATRRSPAAWPGRPGGRTTPCSPAPDRLATQGPSQPGAARTSSTSPSAIICSTRASMRAYSSGRGQIEAQSSRSSSSGLLGWYRHCVCQALIGRPVSSQTSRARMTRRRSLGCSRAARDRVHRASRACRAWPP